MARLEAFRAVFTDEAIAKMPSDSLLRSLVTEKHPNFTIWRTEMNSCLELAQRYDVLDADLIARITNADYSVHKAALNELKVAGYLEGKFGTDSLKWHPDNIKGGKGEFALYYTSEQAIFIEVKTIFPREQESLKSCIIDKLRKYTEQVKLPYVLDITIKDTGTSENISGQRYKNYLVQELQGKTIESLNGEPCALGDYCDRSTGMVLNVSLLPLIRRKNDGRGCIVGVIGGEAGFLADDDYVKHSLDKAYEQRPLEDIPFLVILCCNTAFPIDEHSMSDALFGSSALRYYQSEGLEASIREPEWFRRLNGVYHPTHRRNLSATGLYIERFVDPSLEKKFEIYHNPFSTRQIQPDVFANRCDRQLIKKNDTEMEWVIYAS